MAALARATRPRRRWRRRPTRLRLRARRQRDPSRADPRRGGERRRRLPVRRRQPMAERPRRRPGCAQPRSPRARSEARCTTASAARRPCGRSASRSPGSSAASARRCRPTRHVPFADWIGCTSIRVGTARTREALAWTPKGPTVHDNVEHTGPIAQCSTRRIDEVRDARPVEASRLRARPRNDDVRDGRGVRRTAANGRRPRLAARYSSE